MGELGKGRCSTPKVAGNLWERPLGRDGSKYGVPARLAGESERASSRPEGRSHDDRSSVGAAPRRDGSVSVSDVGMVAPLSATLVPDPIHSARAIAARGRSYRGNQILIVIEVRNSEIQRMQR